MQDSDISVKMLLEMQKKDMKALQTNNLIIVSQTTQSYMVHAKLPAMKTYLVKRIYYGSGGCVRLVAFGQTGFVVLNVKNNDA